MPEPPHRESGDVKSATTRKASNARCSVVYPEAEDEGKPKLFARQSFVVTGEDDEMADKILMARKLAMERRRSVVQEAGGQAAASLPRKPSGYIDSSEASKVELAEREAADPDLQRRRSSVLHRVPDKLKILLQQSDANGVQKKMDNIQRLESEQATTAGFPKASNRETDHSVVTESPKERPSRGGGVCGILLSCFKSLHDEDNKVVSDDDHEKVKPRKDEKVLVTMSTTPQSKHSVSETTKTLLPKQSPAMAGRKLLVLDLDETLVHSSFKPVPNSDYQLKIDVDGTMYNVYVLKRPGVDEFLERVSQQYEVIVFTASLPQYANPLLDLLDPKGLIQNRLFRQVRDYCTFPSVQMITCNAL